MREDCLEQGDLERLKLEFPGVASAERLGIVEEDLVDEPIDAAADDKIDLCMRVVGIPDALDVAEDSGVDAVKFLELINDQRQGTATGFGEDSVYDLLEPFAMSCDMDTEDLLGFFLKGGALSLFGFARHQKVETRRNAIVEGAGDKFCLSNASTSRNNSKPSRFT